VERGVGDRLRHSRVEHAANGDPIVHVHVFEGLALVVPRGDLGAAVARAHDRQLRDVLDLRDLGGERQGAVVPRELGPGRDEQRPRDPALAAATAAASS
jgi:hypothetical protein